MLLTRDNYYDKSADLFYMSHSQYQDWMTCEALALAKVNREWIEPANDNLLVGSYVHAWNSDEMEQFKEENTGLMFTKKGELYTHFKVAEQMITTLESDPLCMFCLDGQKEVIMTAEMFDIPWKIRIDSYNPDRRRIVDLKTTKSITELTWSNELWRRTSFIEAYHYLTQMAVYCEVERIATGQVKWCEPLIVAVSKQDPPDKAVISLNDPRRLQQELDSIQKHIPRIMAVKRGDAEPARCESCAYCRATKRLSGVTFYKELEESE